MCDLVDNYYTGDHKEVIPLGLLIVLIYPEPQDTWKQIQSYKFYYLLYTAQLLFTHVPISKNQGEKPSIHTVFFWVMPPKNYSFHLHL